MSAPTIGQFTLSSFTVHPIGNEEKKTDIKNIIMSFNIVESIELGYVHGTATIIDTEGFLKKVSMNGEEIITITYSDWFNTTRTDEFFLYSLQHAETELNSSDTVQTYTIYFCSIGRLLSSLQLVRVGVNADASEAARNIYEAYFKGVNSITKTNKEIEIEPSGGFCRLVVPAYSPIEAMHFLTRNAITDFKSNVSSSFRFFENREKFWFSTTEHMVTVNNEERKLNNKKQQTSYFVVAQNTTEPEELHRQMFKILGLKFGTRFNTIKDFDDGVYKRRVFELDIISREIVRSDFNLNDDFQSGITLAGQKFVTRHTNPFIENILAEPQDYFVIKDWTNIPSGMRPNPSWLNIMGRKSMHVLHDNSNEIEVVAYGRNVVFAGSVIELELPEFKTRSTEIEKDFEKSGVYLVKSINNEFKNNTYYQTLTLIRPGITDVIGETKMTQKIIAVSPEPMCLTEPIHGAGAAGGSTTKTPSSETKDAAGSIIVDTPAGPVSVTPPSDYNAEATTRSYPKETETKSTIYSTDYQDYSSFMETETSPPPESRPETPTSNPMTEFKENFEF